MAPLQIAQGERVRIVGLSANAEYNNRECVVESFNEGTSRWTVQFDDNIKLRVTPENLRELARHPALDLAPVGDAKVPPALKSEAVAPVQGYVQATVQGVAPVDENGITFFVVKVTQPEVPTTYTVRHRYNDFAALRAMLMEESEPAGSAQFPRKHCFGCKGTRLKTREYLLDQWLQERLPKVHSLGDLDACWCQFLSKDSQQAGRPTATTKAPPPGEISLDERERRRARAAARAETRQSGDLTRGMGDAEQVMKMQAQRQKDELLGLIRERYNLTRGEMPLGLGIASIPQLQKHLRAMEAKATRAGAVGAAEAVAAKLAGAAPGGPASRP